MPQSAALSDAIKLNFGQAIPRHLVHRAAVAEVFLTDAAAVFLEVRGDPAAEPGAPAGADRGTPRVPRPGTGDGTGAAAGLRSSGARGTDRFLVAAQWPRDHALYHPDAAGRSDPLLFAETFRQAMVYVAHRFQDIPLTHRFIGSGMEFRLTNPQSLCVGTTPQEVVLDVRWRWEANRPPQRYGFRVEARLMVEGRRCGHGTLRVVAVDEKRYRLLRGRGAAQDDGPDVSPPADARSVPAPEVGKLRAKDSVLVRGASAGEWWLRLDPDHAILFDHPSDHVPLMALLEGFRQLGHLLIHEDGDQGTAHDVSDVPPPMLVSLTADCLTFGELELPIGLVVREDATVPGAGPVRRLSVDAVQDGTVVATSTSEWLAPVPVALNGLAEHRRMLAQLPAASASSSAPV